VEVYPIRADTAILLADFAAEEAKASASAVLWIRDRRIAKRARGLMLDFRDPDEFVGIRWHFAERYPNIPHVGV